MTIRNLIGTLVLSGYVVSYRSTEAVLDILASNGDPYAEVDPFDRTLSIESGAKISWIDSSDLLEELEKAA